MRTPTSNPYAFALSIFDRYTLSSPVCKAGTLEGIFSVIHGGCALARTVKIPENGTAIFELAPCTQASHCTYFNYVPAITHVLLWAVVLPLSPHRAFVYALLCVHGFWYVVLAGQPQYTGVSSRVYSIRFA